MSWGNYLLMCESSAKHSGARYPSFLRRQESSAKVPAFVLYAIGPLDSCLRRNDGVEVRKSYQDYQDERIHRIGNLHLGNPQTL